MSLLIEPINKAACIRNEKERKLLNGTYKKKSQEDYLMIHMGLTKAHLSKARARDRAAGSSQQLKNASSLLTESNLAALQKAKDPKPPAAPSEISRSRSTSALQQVMPKVPEDPVLAVMMNGPPLFSPALCTRACQVLQ
mmetsp:Transcript_47050/g.87974  ORF Transcript_47050/g.87974 Transcript_47050/m.87974 type:complete len:139 (-) Transcript_47050:40-456(-)